MSIQTEIDRINNAKSEIAEAITRQGVSVPDNVHIDEMAELIGDIENNNLASTGDTTDRLAEIQARLDEKGYVKLGKGEFYLSGQLKISNGATLDGCGAATVIKQTPDTTQSSMIWLQSEGTIKNVCLQGEWTSAPTADTTYNNYRIGLVIAYGTNNAIIDGCFIRGWTAQGIYAFQNGTATRSFLMSNCDVCWCGVGLELSETEYACVTNCVFRNNKYGVENKGGNNKFVGCGFDKNIEGFRLMDGYNDGHGSAVCCTFNHNSVRAVRVSGVEFGYVFSGCQFHDGCINNNNGKGIVFSGCQFGNDMKYYNYTTNPTYFTDCIFAKSPKTESAEYLDGYGGLKFVNCHNYQTGEIINDDNPVGADLVSHIANKSNPHGVTPEQIGALSNEGGSVTGTIDVGSVTTPLQFGTTGYFSGKTSSGNKFDFFGLINSTRFRVGGTYPALELVGKNDRCTYNGSNVALQSDIPSNKETWTFTLENGSTVTKAVYIG